MYTKTVVASARSLLGAGAIACTLFAGNVVAKDHSVIIAVHVSTQGLDLSQPADAQTLYTRLEHAAWVACTHDNRVDLVPTDDPKGCYEKALGGQSARPECRGSPRSILPTIHFRKLWCVGSWCLPR